MDRIAVMRSFLGAVPESSYTRAADGLGISRSLVSRHIADLEGRWAYG